MPQLPYELWAHIASFLDPVDVKNIYGISSAALDIALNARYQEVEFSITNEANSARFFKRLADPQNAARVRSFTLYPSGLCRLLEQSANRRIEERWSALPWTIRTAVTTFLTKYLVTADDCRAMASELKQIIGNMTSLERLVVSSEPSHTPAYFSFVQIQPRFLELGWSAFGPSLKALSLNIPLESLSSSFPPPDLELPKLEELSITLDRAYASTEPEFGYRTFIPQFISRYSATLQSLAIISASPGNASIILEELPHLPVCTQLAYKCGWQGRQQNNLRGLHEFLRIHQRQLRSLTLKVWPSYGSLTVPPPAEEWYLQPCLQLSMPNLRNLDLHLGYFPASYRGGAMVFIHKFRSSLVSLKIQKIRLSYSLLVDLITGFERDSKLQRLDLVIESLSPELLELLAMHLPRLQHLVLDQQDLRGHSAVPYQPGEFVSDLKGRVYTNWALRSLSIMPINYDPRVRQLCKAALIDALPNVEKFSGLTRNDYLHTNRLI